MFLSAFLFVLPFLLGIPLLLLLTLPFSWKGEEEQPQPPTSDSVASLRCWWEDRPILRFCRRVYSIPRVLWSVLPISAHVSEMGNYAYVPPKDHFSTYTVFPIPRKSPFVLQPGAVPPAPPLVQPAVIPPAPSAEMALFKVKDHHVKVLKDRVANQDRELEVQALRVGELETQLQSKDDRLRTLEAQVLRVGELETQLQSKDGRLRELEGFASMVHGEFERLSFQINNLMRNTELNMDFLHHISDILCFHAIYNYKPIFPMELKIRYSVFEDLAMRYIKSIGNSKDAFKDYTNCSPISYLLNSSFNPEKKSLFIFSSQFNLDAYAKVLNLTFPLSKPFPISSIDLLENSSPLTVQPGLGRFLNFQNIWDSSKFHSDLPPSSKVSFELWSNFKGFPYASSNPYGFANNIITKKPLTNQELFFHDCIRYFQLSSSNNKPRNDLDLLSFLSGINKAAKEKPLSNEYLSFMDFHGYFSFNASKFRKNPDSFLNLLKDCGPLVFKGSDAHVDTQVEALFNKSRNYKPQQPEPRGLGGKEELPPGPPAPLESSALAELLGSLGQTGGIALPITLKFMALAYWYVLLAFLLLSLFRSLFPRSSILEEEDWVLQFGALVPIPPVGPRPLLRFIYAPLWIMVFSVSGGMAPAYFRALVVSPLVAVVTPVLLGLFFPAIVLRCWTPGTEKVLSPFFRKF